MRLGSVGAVLPMASQQHEPRSTEKDHGGTREVHVCRQGHVEEMANWYGQPVLEPSPQCSICNILFACRGRVKGVQRVV